MLLKARIRAKSDKRHEALLTASSIVNRSVAAPAQGDEIVLRIIARLASPRYVMDFES